MSQLHPLDNPTRASLLGPHAHFAERRGEVLRYPPEVTPFLALPDEPDAQAWADAATLVGPGGLVPLAHVTAAPPAGWPVVFNLDGVQLIATSLEATPYPQAETLTAADVPEMLELVERTKPGPFSPRTIELGGYLGVRREGRLIAMAGQRLHPTGWTEISAVCTDPSARGEGLGGRLVLAVAAGIVAHGDRPFMHAASSNVNAIRLYQALGFTLRKQVTFSAVQVPHE